MRLITSLVVLLLLFTGCASPTSAPVADDFGKRAAEPAETTSDGRMAREDFASKSAVGSVAAQETVRRLQANDPLLSVAAKSRFAADPGYVAALTGTVILQSTAVQRSSASFASYRIGAIEIHALPDGRVRVWADFTNDSREARTPMVYCRFNEGNERTGPAWRTLPAIGPKQRRLVSFDSKDSNVARVTVLVK